MPLFCLTERKNPASYWYYVPKDITDLIAGYLQHPVFRFQGRLREQGQLKTGGAVFPAVNQDYYVTIGSSYLQVMNYSDQMVHCHRLQQNFTSARLTQTKLIYFNRHWVYQWSLDFKHYEKKYCPLDNIFGGSYKYSHLIHAGWNFLVCRYHRGNYRTDLCYVYLKEGRYTFDVIDTDNKYHGVHLNKQYLILKDFRSPQDYQVYSLTGKKIIARYPNLYPMRSSFLTKNFLVYQTWFSDPVLVLDILTGQIVHTVPLAESMYHVSQIYYKHSAGFRAVRFYQTTPATYELFD